MRVHARGSGGADGVAASLDGAADGDGASVAAAEALGAGEPVVDCVPLQPASTSASASAARAVIGQKDTRLAGIRPPAALDPIRPPTRQKSMPTPELISLIVALVVWIVLLGTLSTDG